MEQRFRTPSLVRQPLTECQPRIVHISANRQSAHRSKPKETNDIPHHESLQPEGNLSVMQRSKAVSPRPSNRRVVAVAEDDEQANKRNSQISTTSTISATRSKRKTHIGPWQLGKTLGKGATGRVRLAKHAVTGQTAAIKIVSKKSAEMVQSASMRRLDQDMKFQESVDGVRTMPFGIEREIVIMKLIEHPNIISLYDIWENRGELYLVLEYVEGGELFEYVARNRSLPEREAVRLLRQLIAGLSYCHRFNICHRDLKPENLLLDRDHNLKIADFGMAALQLDGKCLTTSCGSPHYAAPEIVTGEGYRGSAVDIWSVGIILYAMLNGRLPFDGHDLHDTLRLVRKGEYYMPPELSPEATDLIQRLLQRQPKHRITMPEIWNHPLLRKYEKLHANTSGPGQILGPPPPLTSADCGNRPLRSVEIDRDLLRNLQILLHGASEDEVVGKLINDQPNYEKLFYRALVKFRDEQLENYPGEPLQYSNSDYHHVTRPRKLPRSVSKSTLYGRRSSQFSIISDDSTRRDFYYKNPATAISKTTQGSYDPYRASRRPMTQVEQAETTIRVRDRAGGSLHHPTISSVREETLSTPAAPLGDLRMIAEHKNKAVYSNISSQSSIASSRGKTFKTSASYKRNVVFQHKRRRSSATTSQLQYEASDIPSGSMRPTTQQSNVTFADSRSTPSLPTPGRLQITGPRRPASNLELQQTRIAHSQYDTRKVSAELSKICEEAFNRSSVSCASELSQQILVDSPATTVSVPELFRLSTGKNRRTLSPALQALIERRSKIIETWGLADPKVLADVVETLDRRILEEQAKEVTAERRSATDPTHNASRRCASTDTMDELRRRRTSDLRAVSDPIRAYEHTIRMVNPDLSSPIARNQGRLSKNMPINSLKGGSPQSIRSSRYHGTYENSLANGSVLEPILEDPSRSPTRKPSNPDVKKWAWLNRRTYAFDDECPPTPPRKDTPKERLRHDFIQSGIPAKPITPHPAEPVFVQATPLKKTRWLHKVFRKHPRHDEVVEPKEHEVVRGFDDDDQSIDSYVTPSQTPNRMFGRDHYDNEGGGTLYNPTMNPVAPGQNWFAKFLHLKPATSTLVLCTWKIRARKELVKTLKEWKKFGLQDIEVEKRSSGDIIRARVDATNYLHIKPVQFYISIYTVLEHGRSAKLCIAKFTQEKGAASSFQRVVDTLESVLKESDIVLLDSVKKKAILKSMKEAGL